MVQLVPGQGLLVLLVLQVLHLLERELQGSKLKLVLLEPLVQLVQMDQLYIHPVLVQLVLGESDHLQVMAQLEQVPLVLQVDWIRLLVLDYLVDQLVDMVNHLRLLVLLVLLVLPVLPQEFHQDMDRLLLPLELQELLVHHLDMDHRHLLVLLVLLVHHLDKDHLLLQVLPEQQVLRVLLHQVHLDKVFLHLLLVLLVFLIPLME
eukprot:NODE_112_length_18534_cov_1.163656.p11 type:complete len:205 gc:universal NODE_112_length_18534_cov_1.163656:4329-3715(-)